MSKSNEPEQGIRNGRRVRTKRERAGGGGRPNFRPPSPAKISNLAKSNRNLSRWSGPMKTRVIMTVAPATVVGGIILLLGCGAESKKTSAGNSGPIVITASAEPQTEDPAPPTEA